MEAYRQCVYRTRMRYKTSAYSWDDVKVYRNKYVYMRVLKHVLHEFTGGGVNNINYIIINPLTGSAHRTRLGAVYYVGRAERVVTQIDHFGNANEVQRRHYDNDDITSIHKYVYARQRVKNNIILFSYV